MTGNSASTYVSKSGSLAPEHYVLRCLPLGGLRDVFHAALSEQPPNKHFEFTRYFLKNFGEPLEFHFTTPSPDLLIWRGGALIEGKPFHPSFLDIVAGKYFETDNPPLSQRLFDIEYDEPTRGLLLKCVVEGEVAYCPTPKIKCDDPNAEVVFVRDGETVSIFDNPKPADASKPKGHYRFYAPWVAMRQDDIIELSTSNVNLVSCGESFTCLIELVCEDS